MARISDPAEVQKIVTGSKIIELQTRDDSLGKDPEVLIGLVIESADGTQWELCLVPSDDITLYYLQPA